MKKALVFLSLYWPCCAMTVPAATNDDPALAALLETIETYRVKQDIPAVALTLVSADKVICSAAFGLADRNTGMPVNEQTMFRIGSITKLFTALAMVKLQEDGLLKLEDKVRSLIPDIPLQNTWQDTHPVRVEYLLEHTAGLPDLTAAEFDRKTPMNLYDALMWKAQDRKTRWPPGMHYSYSNAGAGLASYILERITSVTYEQYVRQKIFTPLAMHSASFFADERTLSHLATGYDADSHSVIPYWHMLYRAFGAINIQPSEMAAMIQMLLNAGVYHGKQLFKPESIRRIETPATTLAARSGLHYGYGLGNYTSLHHGFVFHGHGGDGDGYLSRLGYNRNTMMGYFVVINVFRNSDINHIRNLIEDYIVGGQHAPVPVEHILSGILVRTYTGVYRSVTYRFQQTDENINITAQNGTLFIERAGHKLQLIPVNDRHFRYRDESVATAAFVEDADGNRFFQDEQGSYRKIAD